MVDAGRHWQRAWRYIRANQTAPARAALECVLHDAPDDTRARVMLAAVCATDDRPRAAAAQVQRAAATACADPDVLLQLVRIATRVGEAAIAREVLARHVLSESPDPAVLMALAEAAQVLGEHERVLAAVERAARVGASGVPVHFYRGIQLGALGDLAGAERELLRCIAGSPPPGNAFLQLARLRRQTSSHNHVPAIRRAIGRVEQGGEDHAALEFALYKELEDLGCYGEAWDALATGNRLVHARSPYSAEYECGMLTKLRAACGREIHIAADTGVVAGPQPVFVIGLPRSGTTLLERILGNHSEVQSAGELAAFPQALSYGVDHFVPLAVPDAMAIARLDGIDWRLVAGRYLVQSQWRAQGKRFYVDKLPGNWMLAGLVHQAFPRAPILHLVRDPMDVCFSIWRAHLGAGRDYAFAYDLDALAAHYRAYRQMMAHWHRHLPGAILDVEYARLVRESDAVAREVFAFCGLEYESGCIEIARNLSPTATLSMAEVREPIHARAFGEWKPYARQLAGLRASLADIENEVAS